MIVVIAALTLLVVYLANKPAPGAPGSPLPTPDSVPTSGTDGIPSPAKWSNPLAGTDAGQLVMDANPSLAAQQPLMPPPPLPGGNVMSGTALSQASVNAKELIPQPAVRQITTPSKTQRRLVKL